MEFAAFVALAALALLRLPALRRGGASALSELALLTGAGALFMVGMVVPLPILDPYFGGSNVVNLLQNVLATLAIWFMTMTAKYMATGSPPLRRELAGLIAIIVSFTIPFLLMDRGATHQEFVWAYAGNGWLWAYASIYMGYVAYLMVRMLFALRGREPRPYMLVRLGAVFMGTASVIEIIYLTSRLLGSSPEWLGDLFIPVFYGGILLFALGLGWFPIARSARLAALTFAGSLLRRSAIGHEFVLLAEDDPDDTIAHRTYQLALQLADYGNATELSRGEHYALYFATRLLNVQVPAPEVIRMSASPEALA